MTCLAQGLGPALGGQAQTALPSALGWPQGAGARAAASQEVRLKSGLDGHPETLCVGAVTFG